MNLSTELAEAGWLPGSLSNSVLTPGDFITEAIYSLLLLVRLTSIGCAARLLLPASAVSAASLHSWRLLRGQVPTASWFWNALVLSVSGPWRANIIAWCLMVLVGLQEFETAALMQLDHSPVVWAVTLFDAHAAHQPLSDSISMISGPLCTQLILLMPILGLLLISTRSKDNRTDEPSRRWATSGGRFRPWAGWSWLLFAVGIAVAWPVLSQAPAFADAVILMSGNPALLMQSVGQIAVSSGFAIAGAIVALRAATLMIDSSGLGRVVWVALLPGLTGPLVSSLMILAVFQLPIFRPLYDTWLPLLTGSALAVLPRAVLVVVLVRRLAPADAVYCAQLLSHSASPVQGGTGAEIRTRLYIMSWIIAVAAVSHWCFWDVTTVSILRPVDVEPVITRLYNEMHYGRTEVLILMSAVSMIIIPASAAIVLFTIRLAGRFGLLRTSRGHQGVSIRSTI